MAISKVVQDSLNGGVAGTGPAFSAYMSAGTVITDSTWTKIAYNTELFDTASCYNTSTYRFTPNVAGYYQINAIIRNGSLLTASYYAIRIYKNGSVNNQGGWQAVSSGFGAPAISTVLYLNGSTDYIEIYALQNSGSSNTTDYDFAYTFSGSLVRAA